MNNFSRKEIIRLLPKHVSPSVLEEVIKGKQLAVLRPQTLSIIFVDIQGYMLMADKIRDRKIFDFVSQYLGAASNIVLKLRGTVDKYIGDGLMAFWNAPLLDPKHRLHAVKATLDIRDSFRNLRIKYHLPKVNCGIGVHTGLAQIGVIGGEWRREFTALGEGINIAYRIEGLTLKYGVDILVSGKTLGSSVRQSLGGYLFRQVDQVILKGKSNPVKLYQLVPDTPENKLLIRNYQLGFRYYQRHDFNRAKKIFYRLKHDPVSVLMLQRIEEIGDDQSFSGVWSWGEKYDRFFA